MTVEIRDPEAVAEIELQMARHGLSAETVVERVIIDAGCWMPMETLADPYWEDRPRIGSTRVLPQPKPTASTSQDAKQFGGDAC